MYTVFFKQRLLENIKLYCFRYLKIYKTIATLNQISYCFPKTNNWCKAFKIVCFVIFNLKGFLSWWDSFRTLNDQELPSII